MKLVSRCYLYAEYNVCAWFLISADSYIIHLSGTECRNDFQIKEQLRNKSSQPKFARGAFQQVNFALSVTVISWLCFFFFFFVIGIGYYFRHDVKLPVLSLVHRNIVNFFKGTTMEGGEDHS